ncbi:MAG: polyketide cyclase / dehydrase and lipid transport [Actinomycetota bacterium]|nr:polyketide cyclase / dehydrase and lipid transport [Actinomycetota bacterium]
MPAIDIVDSTWICARPAVVAAVVAEPANWRRWWPDLELTVDEWRGDRGVRWTVPRSADGLRGSMEVWLEQALDGVVLHYFLRLDPPDGARLSRAGAVRRATMHRRRIKRIFWSLSDELDPGRLQRTSAPASRADADGPIEKV